VTALHRHFSLRTPPGTGARTCPRTRLLVPAAVAGLGLVLAGCSATNPDTTTRDYAASDGVDLTLGDLDLGNLLVLAAEEGAPGTLLGSVTNTGSDATTVQIGLADDATSVEVGPGETVLLGPDQEAVDLAAVPVAPGALVDLAVGSEVDGTTTVRVPVLDGTLEQYADLVPSS
jgi:hypothetical protein